MPMTTHQGKSRTLRVRLLKGLLIVWVLASILFAHGCHGNEDNELFNNLTAWVKD